MGEGPQALSRASRPTIVRSSARASTNALSPELEGRLLVFGDHVHIDSGAHVKRAETWAHWAERVKFDVNRAPAPAAARAELERIVAALNAEFGASAWLPWQKPASRRSL